MLKVLHVPFTFAPDTVGGTEIYVESLAEELDAIGIESVVAAPSSKGLAEVYQHNGLRVYRFCSQAGSGNLIRELYGLGDPEASAAFSRILDQEKPAIVHVHAFTRAVSVLLVRAAKERGIPVIFTYHTPTVSCQRGTLLRWGAEPCDGELLVKRCTSCSLQERGLPRQLSRLLTEVSPLSAWFLEKVNAHGGMWTALRMRELMKVRRRSFQALMSEVDTVIALKEWVRTVLLHNQVPDSKIVLCEHGISSPSQSSESLINVKSMPLRVAFLGRADVVKGIDTLIRALQRLPDQPIELHLYGVTQSATNHEYWRSLQALIAGDARIKLLTSVPQKDVVRLLKGYHLLGVPSRWFETGPLVILESFLAGTPVIGSNLGGIAEWIRSGENGLLVDFDDIAGWADALKRCSEDRHLLATLRAGIRRPRSMKDVARQMSDMYFEHRDAGSRYNKQGAQAGDSSLQH